MANGRWELFGGEGLVTPDGHVKHYGFTPHAAHGGKSIDSYIRVELIDNANAGLAAAAKAAKLEALEKAVIAYRTAYESKTGRGWGADEITGAWPGEFHRAFTDALAMPTGDEPEEESLAPGAIANTAEACLSDLITAIESAISAVGGNKWQILQNFIGALKKAGESK